MGKFTTKTSGLSDLRAVSRQTADRVRGALEQAVGEEARAVAGDMRRLAPKATGELRESVRSRSSGLDGEVRATARHATFVEYGTADTKPQPFAHPSADLSRRRLPKRAEAAVRKEIG